MHRTEEDLSMDGASLEWHGDFQDTKNWFKKLDASGMKSVLQSCGQLGVNALSFATPTRTGATAASWSFEVRTSRGSVSLVWKNSNRQNGVPIAIILQYGHGTGTGGYVQGRDYINPAMRPVFDEKIGRAHV